VTRLVLSRRSRARVPDPTIIDLVGDEQLRSLLRNPIAGEPRLASLHTDQADRVKQHLERRYPETSSFSSATRPIAAGLSDGAIPNREQRIGDVLAMLGGRSRREHVKVDGQTFRTVASCGMSPEEMRIPVLAWRA